MKNRIQSLKEAIRSDFDGYLVTNDFNMLYFTNFSGAATMLIPRDKENILYVYSVNYEAAKSKAKNCEVELVKSGEDLVKKLTKQIRSYKLEKLGFDAMNTETHQKFSKALGKDAKLEAKNEHLWNLRRVKDEDELRKIRKAAELTIKGMQAAYHNIKAGLREYKVAAEIEYAMRSHGSSGVCFDTSVASGNQSAYPHGGCGERKLQNGDLVVIDVGAKYKNYCADMTRTFVVGKSSAKQEKIHAVVKEAQERAFQEIKDGVKAADVDAAARKTIEKAGYGEYFVHGLGHGVGLEVHEQPVLNSISKDILKHGNVLTNEPGIYIVGFGGVRMEDTIVVRRGRAEKLTDGLYVLKKS